VGAALASADSVRGTWPLLRSTLFTSKNPPFLTRSCCNATYTGSAKLVASAAPYGSSPRQRILRVLASVHNNKDVGP
jgi:hypothetical protein